jgi:hypothetical protein
MMFWFFIESILTLPLLYAIMATIIEFRFGKMRCFTVISLAICANLIMDGLMYMHGIGTTDLYSFAWITTCVPSFLSLLYLAKYRDGRFIFAYLTECVGASIVTAISHILSNLFSSQFDFLSVLLHITLLAVVFIVCRRMFREKLFEAASAQGKRWILYCIMPVLCLIIWTMYISSSTHLIDIKNKVNLPYAGYVYPQDIPVIIILLVVVFYMVFLILIVITSTHQADMKRLEIAALDLQSKALQERVSVIEEKDESLRILRHDMRHHLCTLSSLLENKDYNEAQEYLRQLNDNLEHTKQGNFCSNAAINAIFSYYASKAQIEGIRFLPKIQIPEYLPVDVMDIGAVISNALENAMNACMAQTAEAERFIDIKFIRHKKQFVLDISNSFDGIVKFDSSGRPASRRENHGIGSQSIYAFARKYNSNTDYSTKDGVFSLRIMFAEAV